MNDNEAEDWKDVWGPSAAVATKIGRRILDRIKSPGSNVAFDGMTINFDNAEQANRVAEEIGYAASEAVFAEWEPPQ